MQGGHLLVDYPRELVKFDCFCVGTLAGSFGKVCASTPPIDVVGAFTYIRLPRPLVGGGRQS